MKQDFITTDGTFFDDMRAKERKILEELGDTEALKLLDEEEAAAGPYSPRKQKVQVDEEAEAWINEMYIREVEKKQKESRAR